MTLADVIARMRAGSPLRVQFTDGKRVWWFEGPHTNVPDKIALQAIEAGGISEAGDSLFGLPLNSQTFGSGLDEYGDPLCNISGRCEPLVDSEGISSCRYCGAELHEVDGEWVHHSSPKSFYNTRPKS